MRGLTNFVEIIPLVVRQSVPDVEIYPTDQ